MDEADHGIAAVLNGELDDRAKLILHPYLRWTEGVSTVRGRAKVLVLLSGRTSLARPVSYELRDGQIYRWTGPSAS